MKGEDLFYTDINQILNEEIRKDLDAKAESFASLDWGPDRVVSLRTKDTPVKRQWNGTCTTFGTIGAMENLLGGQVHLSERSLWDFYGKYSTSTAIRVASQYYVLNEEYWPQNESRIPGDYEDFGRYRLKSSEYLGNDYLRVLKAMDSGFPCVVGLSTPKDLRDGKTQIERTSKVSRRGGHAMCVSGYKVAEGRCYFLVKNSWGTAIGDGGYQYIDFELFMTGRKRYASFWSILEIEDRGPQDVRDFSLEAEPLWLYE